jgi:hypothetical protein
MSESSPKSLMALPFSTNDILITALGEIVGLCIASANSRDNNRVQVVAPGDVYLIAGVEEKHTKPQSVPVWRSS